MLIKSQKKWNKIYVPNLQLTNIVENMSTWKSFDGVFAVKNFSTDNTHKSHFEIDAFS